MANRLCTMVAIAALAVAGCATQPKYNPHALKHIETTLAKVVTHPGESAVVDIVMKDIRTGSADPRDIRRFLNSYSDNISHPGESAAYDVAVRQLYE